ncbi:MAG: hypothetical protein R3B13_15580 [Polyangiaceae bacterium]
MPAQPLSFARYRRFTSESELSPGLEYEQGHGLFIDMEEFDDYFIEAVDIRGEDGTVLYQAYFGGCGGMLVYAAGTERLVAAAAQHQLYECEDSLRAPLAEAYANSNPKITERIVFDR